MGIYIYLYTFTEKFWSCCCLSFHWRSNKLKTGCLVSSLSLWLFLCWLGWSSYHLRDVHMLLLLLVNLVGGLDYNLCIHPSSYISVQANSSPWFSATYVNAIVHSNRAFVRNKRINLLNLRKSSDRLIIVSIWFLKLPNLHMLLKQKSLSIPRNSALRTFGEF